MIRLFVFSAHNQHFPVNRVSFLAAIKEKDNMIHTKQEWGDRLFNIAVFWVSVQPFHTSTRSGFLPSSFL
jgi:hypothetical protein